ncbi:hypothetical protein POX_c04272 [Penicillium oxalicum]|uniref:VOC domain-containing protein n=1 Tax=Penicillium oxalicum (strain 114-2 / CGMCC 5302) TaxID=933388 RepID=S7Z5W4_PENO1|nr:hypothetical protein POX_c04272 [Penicillium oxalicum]EPS25895.1 hypothetical protein PDE_00831 [Penicillium oxalicum 114-2]KAI2791412.1 hypothetical protein POX_c04272 [Penicillium oxalicum]
MIIGIAHVNLTVTPGSLDHAQQFYGETLGLKSAPVPEHQVGSLLWFDVGSREQQIHISCGSTDPESRRHPCFRLSGRDELEAMKQAVYEHHVRGGPAAPMAADKPGEENSGSKGKEYPQRFFARDYAGNLLEFTL